MALTVQEILDAQIPDPTWAWTPSISAPIRSDMTLARPNLDTPNPTSYIFDESSALYTGKGADQPRISGGYQGLRVEKKETNRVDHSSNFDVSETDWSEAGPNGVTLTGCSSLFADSSPSYIKPKKVDTDGTSIFDGISSNLTISLTGDDMSFYGIVERGSSGKCRIEIRNSNSTIVARVEYSFYDDSVIDASGDGSPKDMNAEILTPHGPNGGKVSLVSFRVPPNSVDSVNDSTLDARYSFYADAEGNGNDTYLHHAQASSEPSYSSPIMTDGVPATRGKDQVTIFDGGQPEWWPDREQTIVGAFVLRALHFSEGMKFLAEQSVVNYFQIGNSFSSDTPSFLFHRDTSSNVRVGPNDGVSVNPYEINKFAFSTTPSSRILALNGTTTSGSHDGSWLNISNLQMNINGNTSVDLLGLKVLPEALSANNLEILTS